MSQVEGYRVRELMQASIGANTQRGEVTTVFVWFLATHFLDVGGALELHAPPGYELRCTPRVLYIHMPGGSCHQNAGTVSSSGDVFHHYLTLTLTLSDQLIYPNTAYEFGVSALNPVTLTVRNYWGLVLLNQRKEVVDAIMTLEGYKLTDYQLFPHTPLASSTGPTVVNHVRFRFSFEKPLAAGTIGHMTIRAPSTTKILCQQFEDTTGGGSTKARLPLDTTYGTYGTHSCLWANTVTAHFLLSQPILASTYDLHVAVLNPGLRAVKDFWTVELHGPDRASEGISIPAGQASGTNGSDNISSTAAFMADGNSTSYSDWRITKPLVEIQVSGFGISSAFAAGQQSLQTALVTSFGKTQTAPASRPLLLLVALSWLADGLTGVGPAW